jgi:hypothetical protein
MSVFLFTLIWAGVRYVQKLDDPDITNRIFNTFSIILFAAIIVFVLAIGILIISLLKEKNYSRTNKMIKGVIDFLFPVSLFLGKLLGIEKDKIKGSYVNVCNQVVRTKKFDLKPEEILILTPHCLQNASCPHKITINIENCKECGRCPIGDLLKIKKETGVQLVVATGGTLARKAIIEKRPKAIVAVACERDLTSGIQDVKQIPVIGVLNQRPNGPCYNTQLDLEKLKEAINFFLGGKYEQYVSKTDSTASSL